LVLAALSFHPFSSLLLLTFFLENREVKIAKANLERKRCADGHENHYFETTTVSMLKLSVDSKGWCKKSYVLRSRFGLLNLTNISCDPLIKRA